MASVSRRSSLAMLGAGIVAAATGTVLAIPPVARAVRIDIPQSSGAEEMPAMGSVTLRMSKTATHVRLAHAAAELPDRPWLHAQPDNGAVSIAWAFCGEVPHIPKRVWAEVKYADGTHEVCSAVEPPRDTSKGARFPIDRASPDAPINFDFSAHNHQLASYHDGDEGLNNHFAPLYWHPAGFAYNTHQTRGIDVGETPDDILPLLNYARWLSPGTDTIDIGECSGRIRLAGGKDWRANGAVTCFWVVAPDAEKPDHFGRFHLDQPLSIGTLQSFAETAFVIGANSQWQCSWARDAYPIERMTLPLLSRVESFGLSFRQYSQPPIGAFAIGGLTLVKKPIE